MVNLEYYRDLIMVLTKKELQVRYKSSFLGYVWSIANPLLLALIYMFAFKIVMRIDVPNYPLFLICGLFPWQWFANSVNIAPLLFFGNAWLIKKTPFPRETLVIADVMQNMIHFFISIPVIIAFLFIYGKQPSLSWIYGIPLLTIIQFLLISGLDLALASFNLFFRDLERLTSLAVTVLFFVTPIFYSAAYLPKIQEKYPLVYQGIVYANPLTPLIMSWQTLFMDGTMNLDWILRSAGASLIIFLIGYNIYKSLRWRFAEVI